ncbi:MAG TPA: bifunctional UDP-N-acetylglucosamine diphosphorylase/glucosamine-1-phosphate N-acetyltransferase GlmU [Chloroflexia bacterium]|nr:bifunctional UDP-N-acetylglucosamine diphosphorylase/glucosamine-1-phosphate N-acetyltransferase GlmU [Chloroflexia bacterium]
MESQPLAAVVLAAGLGKRMASQQPKVLHSLAGLPLVAHVLRALAPLNPSQTVLVVGHGADHVRAAIGPRYGPDDALSVEYALQPEQLGTGHAVSMAAPLLSGHHGPVLVLYGDSPLLRTATLESLLARHKQTHSRLTMLTCIAADPTGYGRVVRDLNQNLLEVVEERNATLVQRAISEVNSGVYLFDADWLWSHLQKIELNPQGEYYLTDLIGMAIREERSRPTASGEQPRKGVVTFTLDRLDEAMGINSRVQLAEAEAIVQARLRQEWQESGVTMLLPDTVYLGVDVKIGADTLLYPGVILEGKTEIGSGCVLGPNTQVVDSTIGDDCRIVSSTIEGSRVDRGVTVGPYSHLRPGAHLCEGVHLGNFGEVVRSTLEPGVAMGHFSYIGDSHVGEGTNIGAGTITANFNIDGTKSRTIIGKDVFIGSDTMLRAPVEVGDGAITALGSVVTKDVAAHTLVAGVPARFIRRIKKEGEGNGTEDNPDGA